MNIFHCKIHTQTTLLEWFRSMNVAKNKINYLIDNKFCFINDQILDRNSILNPNDYLMIDLVNFQDINFKNINKHIDILYEDEYLIIVNKPKNYIIYTDDDKITVTDIVQNYLTLTNEICFPCHRLDTDTTGCLVFAKDIITLAYMSNIFETKDVIKEYYALVEGLPKEYGTINANIGTDRHINNKMIVTKNGKPAITKYKIESRFNNSSLVKVNLISGRTHQIRVHMSYIGHPLIGDTKYGSKITADRPMLHCGSIQFKHPYYNKNINIKCKLPHDMMNFVKRLNK